MIARKHQPWSPQAIWSWLLMLPFLFFSVHGTFSFLEGSHPTLAGGGDLAGLVPTRDRGPLAYIIFPGIAYSVVLWLILADIKRVLDLALRMKFLSLLALLTMASAAWSQNPFRSLYNGAFYCIGTLFAYALVLRFSSRDLAVMVMRAGILVCAFGLIVIVFFPQFGLYNLELRTANAWRGLFIDRTSAARTLTYLLSPALVATKAPMSLRRAGFILVLLTFIVQAKAVTALLVLFVFVSVMLLIHLSRRLDRRAILALGSVLLPGLILISYVGVSLLGEVLAFFGRDLTLSGRTGIWGPILISISRRPLLGYGFYSFWLGLTGESARIILATHWFFGYAHNGMLEILLQLGLLGLTIFLLTFIQGVRDAFVCLTLSQSTAVYWYIGILLLAVLYNVDEATVVLPNDLLSMLYVVACSGLSISAARFKRIETQRKEKFQADVQHLSSAR